MADKTDVWQGTLALMVLKTLETMGPIHGYGIARRIEQTSGDQLSVNYVASEWGLSDNNRKAKYYRLTQAGLKRLKKHTEEWEQTIAIVSRFLSPGGEAS